MSARIGGSQLESMEATAAEYVKGDIGARLFPRYLGAILDHLFMYRNLFVTDFGHFLSISETFYWVRYGAIDMVTICIVQLFYIDRCCRLFRSWWPAAFLGGSSFCAVGFGCAFLGYTGITYAYLVDEVFENQLVIVLVYGWIGLIVITDLAITITIIVGLRRARTGWSHTDSIIKRIIVRSCEIQLPGLIVALCTAALFAQPDESATFFFLIHTKVYVCGLLTSLNSRVTPSDASKIGSSHFSHDHGYTNRSIGDGGGVVRSRDLENLGDMQMQGMGDNQRGREKGVDQEGMTGNRVKWEEEEAKGLSEFGSTTRLTANGPHEQS